MTPFRIADDTFWFGIGFSAGLYLMGMVWFLVETTRRAL